MTPHSNQMEENEIKAHHDVLVDVLADKETLEDVTTRVEALARGEGERCCSWKKGRKEEENRRRRRRTRRRGGRGLVVLQNVLNGHFCCPFKSS
ncbi:hypothetical protein M9H77_16818 [Catharanthus roseus]|uniref:Uncharacterized protein n=1 Tax=Catharanthus roseus TaxID=4058 RepID=A0ACC0B2T4_CATRO|nr:hypothetical protein M9H77_16818 [Catharanthus roseus]